MTMPADYTPEEWQAVRGALGPVAALIMTADLSGPIGLTQELRATGKTALETGKQSASPLLRAIAQSIEAKEKVEAEPDTPAERPANAEAAAAELLGQITAAVAIVAQKSPAEVGAYKAWLMDVAVSVAEASKEGGFLGFGGTRVSGGERAALEQLAVALDVSPPAL